MPLKQLEIEGYRSIRKLSLPLDRVNVLVGPNGCGKSNLYRSIWLLAEAARGRFAQSLVDEGGMPSVLWAGPRRKSPVRLTLAIELEQLAFTCSSGLRVPDPSGSLFNLDPQIKEETIHFIEGRRRTQLLERGKSSVWLRDAEGRRITYPMALLDSESVLSQIREPHRFPQLSALREEILSWRFYHQFRTDSESPLRRPQPGARTPALAPDGRDLAAAMRTVIEIGDGPSLARAIAEAFPGCELMINYEEGYFSVGMTQPGLLRPLDARELSDGTLRFLCLAAALLSPRPPAVIALNEPETSLHPDLLPALASLIERASRDSQLWVTTHSETLAKEIGRRCGVDPIALTKKEGETQVGRLTDKATDRRP